jgi:SAM-dependent methyltransferase
VDIQDPADYWENRLKRNYGLDGTGFIGLGLNYNKWMYKMRRQVFVRQLRKVGVDYSGANILDVGSGTGFYVQIWKQLGCKELTGIDITFTAIENLQNRYPEYHFIKADIGNLDVRSELFKVRYDIISAIDVLFHIVDDEQYVRAFKNMYNLLQKGGTLLFSENFLHRSSIRSSFQTSRSLEEIERILSKTGFKIARRSPFFVLMNAPVDTNNNILRAHWRVTTIVVKKSEKVGFLAGAFMYPIESLLVSLLPQGPSTELMICTKE